MQGWRNWGVRGVHAPPPLSRFWQYLNQGEQMMPLTSQIFRPSASPDLNPLKYYKTVKNCYIFNMLLFTFETQLFYSYHRYNRLF